ncbi:MAG: pyrroline-5-carboxylate reductase [Planctomycetales bacterium]
MNEDGAADLRLGFIGAGKMATALARGFLAADVLKPDQILASDPSPEARGKFTETTGCATVSNNIEIVQKSNVIVLAVKPQHVAATLPDLRTETTSEHLLISIAAGVRLKTLADGLGGEVRLVRVMPNTPCLVGQGASAYCLGPRADAEDGELVRRLLDCVGTAHQVAEPLLDAVTGLSGSGPAFVYLMIEALADGGVLVGLPRDVALSLAAQTVLGAAQMTLAAGEHPAALKDQVASPGGTTIAGLAALERHGVRSALISAVEAAARRSAELGAESS